MNEQTLDQLQRAAFGYFLQAVNRANGLIADTSRERSPASIAVVGFALSAYPVKTFTVPMHDVRRAIADGEETGFVKIHVKERTDRILGATIVARHAGEMINEITLAMVAGIGLRTLGRVIHAYPTQAEAIKQAADAYGRTRLTPPIRWLLRRWQRW
jgi:Pyridine nucleotide-disulphide oxidoreductase, dimerisation domain